jgi:hypothetical protein
MGEVLQEIDAISIGRGEARGCVGETVVFGGDGFEKST